MLQSMSSQPQIIVHSAGSQAVIASGSAEGVGVSRDNVPLPPPQSSLKGNTGAGPRSSLLRRIRTAAWWLPNASANAGIALGGGLKLSHPALYDFLINYVRPVTIAIFFLTTIPLAFYTREVGTLPYEARGGTISEIVIGWDALLHMSIWPLVVIVCAAGFVLAHGTEQDGGGTSGSAGELQVRGGMSKRSPPPSRQLAGAPRSFVLPLPVKVQQCYDKVYAKWPLGPTWTLVVVLSLLFSIGTTTQSQLQIVSPSWLWNPFMWGKYHVYRPDGIEDALEGLCVEEYMESTTSGTAGGLPLCLKESSWKSLSADALSSRNPDDVETVLRGVRSARQPDHGMIINVMSRDTIDAVEPLRKNVEGLLPFFDKVAVVVFENDSKDGSRQAFQRWADEVKDKYVVDLVECDDAKDCVFGESHRYDAIEADDYFKSSAIGRMAEFRQRIVDHILDGDTYSDYSHMIVVDLDLKVSLSPLGILHTLGKVPDAAVASSGRQTWPASFGTFINPYDFSAFRAIRSPRNARILDLHQRFCALQPAGDRWRNQCDAVSPMHLMLVFGHDRSSGMEPYPVASAFNGATMYPLSLVKSSGAKYDWGEDGQQCEHIGFNLALKKTMYVNPKWDMHISPSGPGGPTGPRAMKNISRIVFTPKISFLIFFQNLGCMLLFIHSVLVLAMKLLYKGWTKILTGTKVKYLVMPWNGTSSSSSVKGGKSLRIDLGSSGYEEEEQALVGGKPSAHDVRKRGTSDFPSPVTSV